ncbi:hypothetical protein [Mycoavidus sp. B2-EB]|uniref:hypothetical protein n=1 Tax=Mycoavidus sp. B2-EB TaxID=2651972 RepID=UPI001624B3B4|nr:hypothetical protein [Mycoavidus sp. B2-EB]BBO59647.1 hypothetical protein MPB2EB_0771 [Mycoavidus sp. B2-EB]
MFSAGKTRGEVGSSSTSEPDQQGQSSARRPPSPTFGSFSANLEKLPGDFKPSAGASSNQPKIYKQKSEKFQGFYNVSPNCTTTATPGSSLGDEASINQQQQERKDRADSVIHLEDRDKGTSTATSGQSTLRPNSGGGASTTHTEHGSSSTSASTSSQPASGRRMINENELDEDTVIDESARKKDLKLRQSIAHQIYANLQKNPGIYMENSLIFDNLDCFEVDELQNILEITRPQNYSRQNARRSSGPAQSNESDEGSEISFSPSEPDLDRMRARHINLTAPAAPEINRRLLSEIKEIVKNNPRIGNEHKELFGNLDKLANETELLQSIYADLTKPSRPFTPSPPPRNQAFVPSRSIGNGPSNNHQPLQNFATSYQPLPAQGYAAPPHQFYPPRPYHYNPPQIYIQHIPYPLVQPRGFFDSVMDFFNPYGAVFSALQDQHAMQMQQHAIYAAQMEQIKYQYLAHSWQQPYGQNPAYQPNVMHQPTGNFQAGRAY